MNVIRKRSLGLLCIGILGILSSNAVADSGGLTVLKQEFDIEVAARQAGDSDEAAARQSADAVLQANLKNIVAAQSTVDDFQNAAIQELLSALKKAQTDIADLRALISKYHPKIGDHVGGGVVFYVDQTGSHGLIAAMADLPNGVANEMPWYNGVFKTTSATNSYVGAGEKNTALIIAAQIDDNPNGVFAAKAASDFSVQDDGITPCTGAANEICHADWYLPSRFELQLLWYKKDVVGGFANYWYWSSTESAQYSASDAWTLDFSNDGSWSELGKHHDILVRPIRAF